MNVPGEIIILELNQMKCCFLTYLSTKLYKPLSICRHASEFLCMRKLHFGFTGALIRSNRANAPPN